MQKNKDPLQLARTKYLEQQCLMQELEGLVHEVQHILLDDSSTNNSDDVDAKLHQAGLSCPADAAMSLAKHLQAAYAAQRLQLPSVAQLPLHGTAEADASTSDVGESDQLGSKHHLLGVTPAQLRKLYMPSRKAAQKTHASLLPLLERRLEQQAEAAVAAIAGPTAGADAAAHVASTIEAKQAELQQLQRSNMEQLLQYTQQAQGYLHDLTGIQQVLQQLVGECILLEQPAADKKHRDYLDAHLKQMIGKLKWMQLQLHEHTYDAKNMPALAAIRAQLQQAERDVAEAVEQVSAQLLAYAQLGDEFSGIVKEYGNVKAKTQELDNVLEHLQKVENETEYNTAEQYY